MVEGCYDDIDYTDKLAISATGLHPVADGLSHKALEGITEGAITAESALEGERLSRKHPLSSQRLIVEFQEMSDAKIIDIGVEIKTFICKILTQICTICPDGFG